MSQRKKSGTRPAVDAVQLTRKQRRVASIKAAGDGVVNRVRIPTVEMARELELTTDGSADDGSATVVTIGPGARAQLPPFPPPHVPCLDASPGRRRGHAPTRAPSHLHVAVGAHVPLLDVVLSKGSPPEGAELAAAARVPARESRQQPA